MKNFEEQFSVLSSTEYEPPSLRKLRQQEFDRFKKIGFPKQSWEAWRFTSLKNLENTAFRISSVKDLPTLRKADKDSLGIPTLLFINGHYQSDLSSLPSGLIVNTLLDSYNDDAKLIANSYESNTNPFSILNTAMMNSGLHLHFSKDFDSDSSIRFLYLTTEISEAIMNHPRLIVDLGESTEATIVEEYRGNCSEPYWNNALTVMRLGHNSKLDHIRIQHEAMSASHLSNTYYQAPADSAIRGSYLSTGSALHRHDVNVVLKNKGADITLNGICLAKDNQHTDHNIIMDHASEHVTSRMLFKYILADNSSGVFNGRAVVRENAQKIDANQTNNNLLLSNEALMNSNPQLEIYADDVRCTHGSTTGQLNEDALFYLRSRGLDTLAAKALLINGFAAEVIDEIGNNQIRN